MTKPLDVIAIGNALVDVLTHAQDDFLTERKIEKGSMSLIDATQAETLYAGMGPAVEISGGSFLMCTADITQRKNFEQLVERMETVYRDAQSQFPSEPSDR